MPCLNARVKILLVANHPDDAVAVDEALLGAGHSIATCNDTDGAPCRGVTELAECPLETSIDVAVIARSPQTHRGIGEMGAVCAARHRVGVVELDPTVPFETSLYDLAGDAEQRICHGYEATVTAALRTCEPARPFAVSVKRWDRDVRIRVELGFGATPLEVTALADRARGAVRNHDRFAQAIDVAVVQGAC